MSKEDDEDPMEYLNKMRAQMETLKMTQAAGEEALAAASNAKDSMERIESLLTSREDEDERRARNQPPPGLSAEDEQEWWTARIAFLSKPVSEAYSDSLLPSADSKPSSDTDGGAKKSSRGCKESRDQSDSKASRK